MKGISIINHGKGSLGLRYFGLGPYMTPSRGLKKLENLLNNDPFVILDIFSHLFKTVTGQYKLLSK